MTVAEPFFAPRENFTFMQFRQPPTDANRVVLEGLIAELQEFVQTELVAEFKFVPPTSEFRGRHMERIASLFSLRDITEKLTLYQMTFEIYERLKAKCLCVQIDREIDVEMIDEM